jgi:hypothetical protein
MTEDNTTAESENDVLAEYREARTNQLLSSEARRILTKVTAARKRPQDAGPRWPFELLQNACDAKPRPGRTTVSVEFGWDERGEGHEVTFQHDAAPFTMKDLSALLSGGSSKDFESDETTGASERAFYQLTSFLCRFVRGACFSARTVPWSSLIFLSTDRAMKSRF